MIISFHLGSVVGVKCGVINRDEKEAEHVHAELEGLAFCTSAAVYGYILV